MTGAQKIQRITVTLVVGDARIHTQHVSYSGIGHVYSLVPIDNTRYEVTNTVRLSW